MVQLEVAAAVNLPFPLERVVAERAVKGGQGQVAQSVHEVPVDLVRILAEARQVLAPLVAQRLRQDMLDRQVADLEVDLLRVTVALLEPFEDDLPLRAASAEVERACLDRLTELFVTWPVAALPGQLPPQRQREAVIAGQVL